MRHRWDHDATKHLAASEFPDGNGRTLRVCKQCGMTKITVHGTDGTFWHEWKTKVGTVWTGEATPPCLGDLHPRPQIASETTAEVIAV